MLRVPDMEDSKEKMQDLDSKLKKKILIIDDNEDVTELMSVQLTNVGYDTTVVNDGQMGLEMIKSDAFNIIILDLAMPGFSGLDVIDSLEKTGHAKLYKIIVSTASEISTVELTNLMKKGVSRWIRKPINFDMLFGILRNL